MLVMKLVSIKISTVFSCKLKIEHVLDGNRPAAFVKALVLRQDNIPNV